MTDQERDALRHLYDLQMDLFRHQGDEMAALRRAIESLQKSHDVLGRLMTETAKLAGFTTS
jgi:hypothetical protein